MTLSEVTHATVEQVDEAIEQVELDYKSQLRNEHFKHLQCKADLRKRRAAKLKKLQDLPRRASHEQEGGAE
jgi:hypothetical protein